MPKARGGRLRYQEYTYGAEDDEDQGRPEDMRNG